MIPTKSSLATSQYENLSDEELEARIREVEAVGEVISSEAWRLVSVLLRRRADRAYLKLAAEGDVDEIRRVQAWLSCYGDLIEDFYGFLDMQQVLVQEKRSRMRVGLDKIVDRWKK